MVISGAQNARGPQDVVMITDDEGDDPPVTVLGPVTHEGPPEEEGDIEERRAAGPHCSPGSPDPAL